VTTAFVGGAFYWDTGSGGRLITLMDGVTPQIDVSYDGLNNITINRNGTNIGTVRAVFPSGTWTYVELQAVAATGATGTIVVRVNNAVVFSLANVATCSTSNAYYNGVQGGYLGQAAAGGSLWVDDFYVCDNTGTGLDNNFLGDVRISALMPSGNGRVNQWTRIGGTTSGNYTAVSEAPPDGDTSYVADSNVGDEDCYTLGALPGNAQKIMAVQVVAYARKDDAGARVLGLGFGNGTSEAFDSGTNLGTSYTWVISGFSKNPLTGNNWAVSDFATLQAALQVIS
jgi:hypothetical protein